MAGPGVTAAPLDAWLFNPGRTRDNAFNNIVLEGEDIA